MNYKRKSKDIESKFNFYSKTFPCTKENSINGKADLPIWSVKKTKESLFYKSR